MVVQDACVRFYIACMCRLEPLSDEEMKQCGLTAMGQSTVLSLCFVTKDCVILG